MLLVIPIKAQVVFDIVNNDVDSTFVGYMDFEYAGNLDGASTDWNCPNMYLQNNSVEACLVLVNDKTNYGEINIYGDPSIHDACDSSTFEQDLTGKIAVMYRGICEFGLKAYNVQKRGAIAAIIINHTGGPITMLGGIFGTEVNIPLIMIGEEDGAELVNYLDTVCTGVIGYLGTSVNRYNNDVASTKGDAIWTESYSIPSYMTSSMYGSPYNIDFGLRLYNYGVNPQNNVTVSVFLERNLDTLYTNTSTSLNFNAPDTTFVDTQYVDLGTFTQSYYNTGLYTITYVINNLNDDDIENNIFSSQFKITSGVVTPDHQYTYFKAYSKSRTNSLGEPISTDKKSSKDFGYLEWDVDFWEACVHYYADEDLPSYMWGVIGLKFSCYPVGNSMANEIIELKAYKWNDNFVDINDSIIQNTWSLTELASSYYFYYDDSKIGETVFASFDNTIMPIQGNRYLFCLYSESDSLALSYDDNIDYKETINHYRQPISTLRYNIYEPFDVFQVGGFGSNWSPSISVGFAQEFITPSVQENTQEPEIIPYPNPSSNWLTIPLKNRVNGAVQINVFDMLGKQVLSENTIIRKEEALKINVASIPNGNYLFQLTFSNGEQEVLKISVNR